MPITSAALHAVAQAALESAREHRRAARLADAEACCMQVLDVAPGHAGALHLLGLVASDRDNTALALNLIDRAIEGNPREAAYHAGRAEVLRRCGLPQDEIASLRRALELDPRAAAAQNELGLALLATGKLSEAIECFEQAVAIDPLAAQAQFNLGRSLKSVRQFERATQALERAAELDRGDAQIQFELACVADLTNDPVRCETHCRRALELKADFAAVRMLLGNAHLEQGDYAAAAAAYRRAVDLDPGMPQARYQLALSLLRDNDYARAWPLFESRFDPAFAGGLRAPLLPMPMWRGESIEGKRLLILTEQGYGDHIQFCRFVSQLAARDVKAFVCASPPLVDLMQTLPGCSAVMRNLDDAWDSGCDYWTFIGSLPYRLGVDAFNIPADTPYLAADPPRVDAWRARFAPFGGKLKVGLFWAGRPNHLHDRNRSLTLAQLAPLARVEGVAFFGLQQDERANETPADGMQYMACGQWLHDFGDTAAFLFELDLLISVDSAPAHLAGALHRPVWTLLPFRADWRWQTARADSPWYPSMRLFRQPQRGDWQSVIDNVCSQLSSFTGTR